MNERIWISKTSLQRFVDQRSGSVELQNFDPAQEYAPYWDEYRLVKSLPCPHGEKDFKSINTGARFRDKYYVCRECGVQFEAVFKDGIAAPGDLKKVQT